MKRFLLLATLLLCFFYQGRSVVTIWAGSSGGNWNDPLNWSNGVPSISDDVIFNTSVTVIFTTSPIDLNSLTIVNNSSVIFSTSTTITLRPRSTSEILPALLINAGSILTLDATNTVGLNNTVLNMTFGNGVIGTISGTLIISSSGASTDTNIRFITSNTSTQYGIVQVSNGGSIIIKPNAGNTASSLIPVPTLIMKNGSVYENQKNGGSFPEGLWEPNSLARALSPGTNGPSFNGNIYGNLEWNCPNQTALNFINDDLTFSNVNLISTGVSFMSSNSEIRIKTGTSSGLWTMTINGNLNIGSDARLVLTSSNTTSGNGARLYLKGSLYNQGSLTTSGVSGTINDFELNGTSNQTITNNGIISGDQLLLIINNSAGVTLNSELELPGNLSLINGVIKTTSTNILTIKDGATATGGTSSSFIEGPMKKIGDEDFTFPLGKGTMYAPLSISGSGGSASDAFTAEYIRANPQSTTPYGPEVGAGLDHVSYVEYWTLTAGEVSPKNISLQIHSLSFCKMLLNTFMAKWNSSIMKWEKINTSPSDGPYSIGNGYITGKIITTTPFVFGINPETYAFTLATDQSFDNNPLPVDLISFQAKRISSTRAILNWELAACCLPGEKFEIEKAGDDRRFKTIETISGNETDRFYSTIDHNLKAGNNYYRLKMIDANHTIRYSHIIAVLNGKKEMLITMSPTIVKDNVSITITSATVQQLNLFIADVNGRIVKSLTHTALQGNSNITLSLGDLSSGVYHITGVAASGQKDVIRFIKQ